MDGWHFDGDSAVRHIVSVTRDGDRLLIDGFAPVPIEKLVARGDGSRTVFGHRDIEGWRLGFDAPLPADWQAVLPRPERYGGLVDRFGLAGAVAGGIALSGALIFGLWKAPEIIAPLVPQSWERKLGDAIVGDLGGRACTGRDGQQALDRLASRLSPDGTPMRVRVVDIAVPNAVALPGGQIAIFSGLIAEAKSSDEVAGVLAHEIGHVKHRHVMAGLIRQFGFGLLLGGSSKAGEYAQVLLSAGYTRAAEREADRFAIRRLSANSISTRATADFFGRAAKSEAGMETALSWLSTHPVSRERRDLFRTADKAIVDPRPAMDAKDWRAVRRMCKTAPDGKRP